MRVNSWVRQKLTENSLMGQIVRKSRRFYIGVFHRPYVAASVKHSREGECHRCGRCCKLVVRCPFLGHDSQNLPYCRIYDHLRPANCRVYPFDRFDSEVEACGYRFNTENR